MRTWWVGACAALLCACAPMQRQRQSAAPVPENALARIPDGLRGPVEQARAQQERAKDALLRAQQDAEIATREAAVELARWRAEGAQRDVIHAQQDLAQATGNRQKIDDARAARDRLEARLQVLYERADVASARRDQVARKVDVARASLGVAKAKRELAQYQALVKANDVAADPAWVPTLETNVRQALEGLADARDFADGASGAVAQAERRLQLAELDAQTLDRRNVRGSASPERQNLRGTDESGASRPQEKRPGSGAPSSKKTPPARGNAASSPD